MMRRAGAPMMILDAAAMQGRFVRLEPFSPALRDELGAALDVDPEAWALQYVDGQGEAFGRWWAGMMREVEAGTRIGFGVRAADGRLVGTSSYIAASGANRTVEVGSTFYRPEARGTAVNPETKLLMLGHAFERGALRVQLIVDSRNARSQAAVTKLGAVREGVLRRHLITWTGWRRDSVVFSVIDTEWPGVRAGLEARVASFVG
jgi:RimJ/RimL family protein N-acetyltransferase